jgi:pimeloyl-ACP methyl ester carboxylesterase
MGSAMAEIASNSEDYLRPASGTAGGIPYLRVGEGPPMAFLLPQAGNVRGWQRNYQIRFLKPILRHSTMYVIAGKPDFPAGITMSGIAAQYAAALNELFREPVAVMGASTGGSLALQLAIDHPDAVKRLIVVAAAPRLSAAGRSATSKCAELIAAGRPAAGFRALAPALTRPAVGQFFMGLGLMLGAAITKSGRGDAGRSLAAVLRAEVSFDVQHRIGELKMPVLVIAGTRDGCYDFQDSRDLAMRASQGRLVEFDLGHRGVIVSRRIWPEVIASAAGQQERYHNQPQ